MQLDFQPIAERHVGLVEQWLDDPESRRRLGGMIPFRPCFEFQQRSPHYHEWVVYDGAAPVGLAGFEIQTDGSAAVVLLIPPHLRRRGYGRNILAALCRRPEAQPATNLIAPVEPDHEAAIRCVESAGFVNRGPDPATRSSCSSSVESGARPGTTASLPATPCKRAGSGVYCLSKAASRRALGTELSQLMQVLMKTHVKAFGGAALVAALLPVSASAGVITHSLAVPPGPDPVVSGPGLGLASVPIVSTPTPNNDNVAGGEPIDNNVAVNLKRFDFNDYIDIVFTVAPSQGVTEYQIVEFVDNNTGIPWIAYHMQLGFGVGANFTLTPAFHPLDFDTPLYDPPPTSTAMTITSLSPNELVFTGFQDAGAQEYVFRIDVPDLTQFGNQFTLRQFPIPIPEPASLALAGMATMLLARRRR